jgi:16S rRNA (guanine527-N7)-methyltransferase
VKHPLNLNELYDFLESRNFSVTIKQREHFHKYLDLLKIWTKKQNLVSQNDIPHIVERHYLPSLYLYSCLPEKIGGDAIDIGSGGGFPGIILKIMRPDLSMTLLDSSHKKVIFLQEVCDQLNLNCPIIGQRCEYYQYHTAGKFELFVSRGVASLDNLWRWTTEMMAENSKMFVLKGGNYQREVESVKFENVTVGACTPSHNWLNFSNYMKNKWVVILEK